MKKRVGRALVLMVFLFAVATPVFGGDSCEACNGYYDPSTYTSYVFCARATDGEMGSFGCTVQCGEGVCQCMYEGPPVYCMTIVVQG